MGLLTGSCCVLSTTCNSSCAVVCSSRACCRLCLGAHVVSVCTACPQPRPAPCSTIHFKGEQSPTPHSSISQVTFSMRLHQSSISMTILSTSLWPHMLVPISSYPTYPILNNPVSATLAFNHGCTLQDLTSPAISVRCICVNGTTMQRLIIY